MRTVKRVSDFTGISARTLHYYDEIGLLKPSKFTDAGYRLYDDEALQTLQQILFFKELDLPLKEIKEIMDNPNFDKSHALESHKRLLILKRNRLNNLIELINKTLKGENTMSFKEFDMSDFFNALEEFKKEHEDKVIKYYGSVDKYNEHIEKFKSNQDEIAKMAIKKYGSIEKYAKAMKKNLNSDVFIIAERYDEFKKDCLEDNHPKLKELYKKLVSDLSKNPNSKEIQQIVEEIAKETKKENEALKVDEGENHWGYTAELYLSDSIMIKVTNKEYGDGASKFIGEALKFYSENNEK